MCSTECGFALVSSVVAAMDLLEIANVATFIFGLVVTFLAIASVVRFFRWINRSELAMVIVACLADDIVDNVATLIFSLNTFIRTMQDKPEAEVNWINPWIAIALRLAIFGVSFITIFVITKRAKQDEAKKARLFGKIQDTLATD
ncbi:MAG: hypothetical protein AAF745_02590 [Planctomycetota bacterium]